MAERRWIVVSLFTSGTGYEQEAGKLRASLDALGIDHYVFAYPSVGSWRGNLNYKSASILEAFDRFPDKDIVFIDADAVVRSYPTRFDELSECGVYDMAAHFFEQSRVERGELLSGTLWFANNDAARRLVREWDEYGRRNPGTRHQKCLQAVLKASGDRVRVYRLPLEYTCIFDHPARRGKEAVIEHFQASRRYRKQRLGRSKLTKPPHAGVISTTRAVIG